MTIEEEEHEKRAKEFVAKYEKLILDAVYNHDANKVFELRDGLVYDLRRLLETEYTFGSEAQYKRLQEALREVVKKY